MEGVNGGKLWWEMKIGGRKRWGDRPLGEHPAVHFRRRCLHRPAGHILAPCRTWYCSRLCTYLNEVLITSCGRCPQQNIQTSPSELQYTARGRRTADQLLGSGRSLMNEMI